MSLATRLAALESCLDSLYARYAGVGAQLEAANTPGAKGYNPTASGEGTNADNDGHVDRLHRELASIIKQIDETEAKIDRLNSGGDLGTFETQCF